MRSSPIVGERADGCRHGDRTHDVRAAGLFPVGKVGPDDGVGRDGAHRAASSVIGCGSEGGAGPDQGAGSVRGVHLVGREGDEVEMAGIVVGRMSIGRCGASWAASTRIRPPAAWTFSANSCTGCTTPVTFEAPDTARSATRPACSARHRSRSSTSNEPSGPSPTCTVRTRPLHGRSFEWCSSIVVSTTESSATANERASLLIASVVFLANTTTSRSGSAPRNSATSSRGTLERDRAHAVTCSQFPDGRPSRTVGTPRSSRRPT